jgi:glycogen operon protein
MGQRLQGSPDLYQANGRGATASINFITCHDGFTLMDLVSFNQKHNEANGEDNRDGTDDNHSWNCGAEGWTDDPGINFLRMKQIKNAIAMLLMSQGVPMILMGDEIGRSQQGNNNAYCHDSPLAWMDWGLLESNHALFRFVSHCIRFRHRHPVLRNRYHLSNRDYVGSGYADITWHGTQAWNADWSASSRTIAFMLDGKHARGGHAADDTIYVAMNMHWDSHVFELPKLPEGQAWHIFANTGMAPADDVWEPDTEPLLSDQNAMILADRSVCILVGRAVGQSEGRR